MALGIVWHPLAGMHEVGSPIVVIVRAVMLAERWPVPGVSYCIMSSMAHCRLICDNQVFRGAPQMLIPLSPCFNLALWTCGGGIHSPDRDPSPSLGSEFSFSYHEYWMLDALTTAGKVGAKTGWLNTTTAMVLHAHSRGVLEIATAQHGLRCLQG